MSNLVSEGRVIVPNKASVFRVTEDYDVRARHVRPQLRLGPSQEHLRVGSAQFIPG